MEFYGVLHIDRDVYHIMTCRSFFLIYSLFCSSWFAYSFRPMRTKRKVRGHTIYWSPGHFRSVMFGLIYILVFTFKEGTTKGCILQLKVFIISFN